ncbi:NAD(P)-dependent oxidoreductase [Polynucleobacter sp. Tro8-14-1]|uniref:NAD-dependent epimerase/dehydratase family protein n=1 Tax=Polynucleobacter sp. Tro8-14-1 TaxID=1758383 RepID=UPI001C0CB1D8|nr:NAD-dependent epimerase/dehydratase family protein [Polynucleobacter sp. Tro8-14-1]
MHLVTGGSGFLGSNIARRLHARGENVRVLDLWKADDLPEGIEFIEADINNRVAVRQAMTNVEYVHHNVALVPLAKAGSDYWKVNVDGTRVALEEAQRAEVKMFCHMSSSAIFGCPDDMPITNNTPREPIEIYGRAKKAGEDLVFEAMKCGLKSSIVRPRTIIGTGRLGIFEILFDWIRDGANIYIIGSGNHPFQFAHVDDISDASINSCLLQKSGAFNIGALEFGNLYDDLKFLCEYANTGSKVKSLPIGPTIGSLKLLDTLGLSPLSPWHYLTYHKPFFFDSMPAFNDLGYSPAYSNRRMMTESYDWFLGHFDASKIKQGSSAHKKPVKQGILKLLKAIS